jgi:ABC-type transport system substrate-binding protein
MKTTTKWLLAGLAALAFAVPAGAQQAREKVLHYAFSVPETGMDPQQVTDLYSRNLTANIFDGLYDYTYFARPVKIRPVLADGLPEISTDFRTWTVHLKHGVYFADDPAFGGKKREFTAADVVYTFKRIYDPKTRSELVGSLDEEQIIGLSDLRERAEKSGKFDYETEIEGLKALDRYTVRFKLAVPRPRFASSIADPSIYGIVAHEVVEKYGDTIMEHPVGTGPYMLSEWRRSSQITLVKNPNYREEYLQEEPMAGDELGAEIAAHLKGKRLPLVDKVVVSIIQEAQPRWLSFLNQQQDLLEGLPPNFVTQAIPNNKIAPNLAKKGIRMQRVPRSDISMFYFNLDDKVVGGYTPEQVALRRAISMAYNSEEEVRLPRRGQAIVAQSVIQPNTDSYDPKFRSELGVFDRAKAMALLDMYGYTDRNGDGWRERPDGSPLVLEIHTPNTADQREYDEILKKNLDAVGLKVRFISGLWPEQLKAARAGTMPMWQVGLTAASPNSGEVLALGSSLQIGQQNYARFRNKRYDEIYEKQGGMPDGPERDALIRDAARLLIAYMPYKARVHRIGTDMWQGWLIGYKRHPFALSWWRYIDIDADKQAAK